MSCIQTISIASDWSDSTTVLVNWSFGLDSYAVMSETYRFTGKPVSQTTGLYYYGARWYDSSVGRFISQDPYVGHRSDPQSLNRYIYVENSPLNNNDPSGEFVNLIAAAVGAAAGFAIGYVGCGIVTGGWTSTNCLITGGVVAATGALAGLTFGASLAVGEGAALCEEEDCLAAPVAPSTLSPPTSPTTVGTTSTISEDVAPTLSSETSSVDDLNGQISTEQGDMTTVRHYTSWVGRAGITQSGAINPSEDGFVYVTTPSEVEGLTTPPEIGIRLGIPAEKAVTYYEFQYSSSQLENLGLTSGGAQQFGILGRVFLSQVGGNWWPAVPQ